MRSTQFQYPPKALYWKAFLIPIEYPRENHMHPYITSTVSDGSYSNAALFLPPSSSSLSMRKLVSVSATQLSYTSQSISISSPFPPFLPYYHFSSPWPTLPSELGAHALVSDSEFCSILSLLSISDSPSQFSHPHTHIYFFHLCFAIFLDKICWIYRK